MKVLYFDPILGVSGDMILAALIDLGVPHDYLKRELRFIGDFKLMVKSIKKQGVSAKNIQFIINKKIAPDRFIPLIEKSHLTIKVKPMAIKIIKRIFDVEKKIHKDRHLHLHELADMDTLLDVTGALVAIDYLGVDKIYTRPIKAGYGFIKTVEGNMPAFNFATAQLLKGFPVHFLSIPFELTTPTGAAILSTVAEPASDLMLSKIYGVGLGAGIMNFKDYPNLLRVFSGEIDNALTDECLVVETNIDDMNPQDYEILFEQLYAAGALEVFLTPPIMKHSRSGVLLTVLCESYANRIFSILFNLTTTIGLRIRNTKRLKLKRRIVKVPSPYGTLRVKIVDYQDKKRFSLEYQDLKKIARRENIPMQNLRIKLTSLVEKYIAKNKL